MKPSIQLKRKLVVASSASSRKLSELCRGVLLLGCFAACPIIQAVSSPPDGVYANGNTAEGSNALF